jgi:NitT/TauT family transport system substrate-binding protein
LARLLGIALALCLWAAPTSAQQPLRIGIGYGLAFVPVYLCQELGLIEKHAREAGLRIKASYERFAGAGEMQDAIRSGRIDIAPYGIAALLTAREHAKDARLQPLAVSGMTTMTLVLLTNNPKVKSIADFKSADRIAVPTLAAPQVILLQMQAEKTFGTAHYDRLRDQVVALPHPQAAAALLARSGEVTAYFSSPPFTQVVLRDRKIGKVLTSSEVVGGKTSFLVLGATRRYVDTHGKVPGVVGKAMEEAAALIRSDPGKVAAIYLKYEPAKTLDVAAIEAILRDLGDDFGSAVHGIEAHAQFMARVGRLKSPPKTWKDVVAPALFDTPGT